MAERKWGIVGVCVLTMFMAIFVLRTELSLQAPYFAMPLSQFELLGSIVLMGIAALLLLPLMHISRAGWMVAAGAFGNYCLGLSLAFSSGFVSLNTSDSLWILGCGALFGLFYWLFAASFGVPLKIKAPGVARKKNASLLAAQTRINIMKISIKPDENLVLLVRYNGQEVFRQELEAGRHYDLEIALPKMSGKAEVFLLIDGQEMEIGSAEYNFEGDEPKEG